MTIGKVAKSVGLSIQTVRFYEKKGLIKPGGRSPSGYRIYDENAIVRLKFIKNARGFGFSLNETASLVRLLESSRGDTCSEVKEICRGMLKKYKEEMAQLNSRFNELSSVVDSCPCGTGRTHDPAGCKMFQKLVKGGK
jgi:DNA-binding transcriptional MerR regulator